MEKNEEYIKLKIKPLSELKCFDNTPGERLTLDFPKTSGVYILADDNGDILYIGKAKTLRSRVIAHTSFGCRTSWVDKKRIKKIYVIECPESINDLIEVAYQHFLKSEYNNNGDAFKCLQNAGISVNKFSEGPK